MPVRQVEVPSIGCDGCVRTIQQRLKSMEGVREVHGDVESKSVMVDYDTPDTWSDIVAALKEIDYAPSETVAS